MLDKKKTIFIISFSFVLLIFYIIKFYSPQLITMLYQNQHIGILNQITGSNQTQTLEYYTGEIENILFGPLTSVIAGGAFLIFCLVYLKEAADFSFGIVVFLYLLLTRPEILGNPPFGEGITGPFSDAMWLVQNHLNYIGLLHQDTVMQGGPQIYPTALYPYFLALMIKICHSSIVFLVSMHLLVFAMAAAVVALLRNMMRKFFDENIAIATAVLILSFPLFQSMAELINLEMPCLFFAVLSCYYLVRNRIVAASLASALSLVTKDPGIIACLAVFLAGLKLFFTPSSGKERRNIVYWVSGLMVFAVGKTILRSLIIREQKVYAMVSFLGGWRNLVFSVWFWIYLSALIIFIIHSLRGFRQQPLTIQRALSWADKNTGILMFYLMATLYFLLYLNFLHTTYRYELLLLPFVFVGVVYSAGLWIQRKAVLSKILNITIIISFLCSHGLAYGSLQRSDCFPTYLERSLEYRNYLKLEKTLARYIEDHFSDYTIVSPFQTAQLLALPQLGYVGKQMDVVVYGMRPTLGLKRYTGFKDLNLMRTIYIGYPQHRLANIKIDYPISPEDKIIRRVRVGHLEVVVFMGGFGIERMRRVVEFLSAGRLGELGKKH